VHTRQSSIQNKQTAFEIWWHTRRKPDFVFRRNGRVHLNRQGRQFSRLLAAEVWASAVVMLDTPCSEVVWRVLATHSIRQFPLHFRSRALPCAITFQLDSTKCRINTVVSPDDGHVVARNMYRLINILSWLHLNDYTGMHDQQNTKDQLQVGGDRNFYLTWLGSGSAPWRSSGGKVMVWIPY
jgi:hypothetical protein